MDNNTWHFQTMVDYRRPGMSYNAGAGNSGDTLEGARDAMAETVRYYRDLPDVQIVKATVRRVCGLCNGAGQVRRGKRVIKYVRCPNCRGKDSDTIVETWADLPRSVWV